MESRHVRHFLAAYDAGTFAGAAERLRLSQQAISKSISRLESHLGVRLFERDGRRVRPSTRASAAPRGFSASIRISAPHTGAVYHRRRSQD